MKSVLIQLDDAEYEQLNRAKGNLTWKQFLLSFSEKDPEKILGSFLEKEPELLLALLEKELKKRKSD